MELLFQVIILYVLLLLLAFTTPALQPIFYAFFFFLILAYTFIQLVLPFGRTFFQLFEPLPHSFLQLVIGSFFLLMIGELIADHLKEVGYRSIANVALLAVKVMILSMWLPVLSDFIENLLSIIKK